MNSDPIDSPRQAPVLKALTRILKRTFDNRPLPGDKAGGRSASGRSRNSRPIALEPLEARLLLSASVPVVDAGALPADRGDTGVDAVSVRDGAAQDGVIVKLSGNAASAPIAVAATTPRAPNAKVDIQTAINAVDPLNPTRAEDADEPSGPVLSVGTKVTWTYLVSNEGKVALQDIVVRDNHGTVSTLRDDFYALGVKKDGVQVGDRDKDNLLDVGEVWLFTSAGTVAGGHTVVAGQYTNTATVSGRDLGKLETVRDTDSSSHFGVLAYDGCMTGGGSVLTREGMRVTHGFELHSDPVLEPNNLQVNFDGNRFHLDRLTEALAYDAPGIDAGKAAFDTLRGEGVGWFNGKPGYRVQFLFTDAGERGTKDFARIQIIDPKGATVLLVAGYLKHGNHQAHGGTAAAITVEKAVNAVDPWHPTVAEDADTIPLRVDAGDAVRWSYLVRAHGNLPLDIVRLVDDAGTPGDKRDDFVLTNFVGGDKDRDGLLDPGETWLYLSNGKHEAQLGRYTNTVTVTAKAELPHDDDCFCHDDRDDDDDDDDDDRDDDDDDDDRDDDDDDDDRRGDNDDRHERSFTRTRVLVDTDSASYFGTDASSARIRVEKAINAVDPLNPTRAEDADAQTGPVLSVGTKVTWTYLVSNEGNVALKDIRVVDDHGTRANNSDNFDARGVFEGGFRLGDVNRNNILDIGEVWLYTSAGTAAGGYKAVSGQYTNTATVRAFTVPATSLDRSKLVSDSDPSNHFGVAKPDARIRVEKAINAVDPLNPTRAEDADEPSGPVLSVGTKVTWTYLVSNEGKVALQDIVVRDNHGTVSTLRDDFYALGVKKDGVQVGDRDKDNLLDVGEVWLFTSAGTVAGGHTVVAGQYTNTATVSGRDLGKLETVRDTDSSSHFGVLAYDGCMTGGGSVLTREGMRVTHGFELHSDPVLEPNNLQVNFDGNRFHLDRLTEALAYDAPGIDAGKAAFDTLRGEGVGWFNGKPGYRVQFLFTDAGERGTKDFARIQIIDPKGATVLLVAGYLKHGNHQAHGGTAAAITVEKAVNAVDPWHPTVAEDADTIPLRVDAGDAVRWSYLVRAHGNLPLDIVRLVDDAGTPGDKRDDFVLTNFVGGDKDRDGLLDPGETWLYLSNGKHEAQLGRYTNTVTVTAKAELPHDDDCFCHDDRDDDDDDDDDDRDDDDDDDDRRGDNDDRHERSFTRTRVLVDTDSASYFGTDASSARIRVEKAINAVDPLNPTRAEDADAQTGPVLSVGTKVTWTYLVSNEGNVALKDIRVVDDHGTRANNSDNFDARGVFEGGFRLGDVNRNNILDIGEVWLYTSAGTAAGGYKAVSGQYTNTATVRAFTVPATSLDRSKLVSDSDPSNHVAIDWSKGLVPSNSSMPTSRGNADSGKWLNTFVNSNGGSKASANGPISTLKVTLPVPPAFT